MKKDIKFCSTITINTDASYSSQHKVGGFAFYIVCDYFRIKVSGRLKGTILSAREAEIKAIANAFHYLLSMEDLPKCSWLIINTDCTPAIDDITMRKTPLGKNVHKMWHQLRDRTQVKGAKSKFRHVKAHNGAPDARSWVNEWCDMTAKRHMRSLVHERLKQTT